MYGYERQSKIKEFANENNLTFLTFLAVRDEDSKSDVIMSLYGDKLCADLINIGEGYCGDYDPLNPEDQKLIRFDVSVNVADEKEDPVWEQVSDGSFCTCIPVESKEEVLEAFLLEVYEKYSAAMELGDSLKPIGESLSRRDLGDYEEEEPERD